MASNPVDLRRRSGEKSNFSVTCGLLSQYLKEKGSFGDLSLGMNRTVQEGKGKSETLRTMNLLPSMEAVPGDDSAKRDAVPDRNVTKSMNLFPQHAGLGPSSAPAADDSGKNKADARELQTAQLTIFYDGKVVVFDNFPAEKAKELMVMAGRGSPSTASQNLGAAQLPRPSCPPPTQHNSAAFASISDAKPIMATQPVAQDRPHRPPQPMASELPIMRKISLHRFLEKRKDRISSKAPYQVNGSSSGPSPAATSDPAPVKQEESQPWLGLAPQVRKPEQLRR